MDTTTTKKNNRRKHTLKSATKTTKLEGKQIRKALHEEHLLRALEEYANGDDTTAGGYDPEFEELMEENVRPPADDPNAVMDIYSLNLLSVLPDQSVKKVKVTFSTEFGRDTLLQLVRVMKPGGRVEITTGEAK